jgi:uncharacterized membrane protein YhaH (DUF805 family)
MGEANVEKFSRAAFRCTQTACACSLFLDHSECCNAVCGAFVFLDAMLVRMAIWVFCPPFFWIAFALAAKCLHDAEQSVVWLLALLVPVLGPLAVDGICLMFRKGSPGQNQYGPDPLEFGDYLVVDIHQLFSAK